MLRRRVLHAPGPSRRRAFAEDSDRIGGPEPALFLDATVPVPFAGAEGFWIDGLVDDLNCYLSPLIHKKGLLESQLYF